MTHSDTQNVLHFVHSRPSLLTRRTCANKPRKWMLPLCVRRKPRTQVLNVNWPKLHWWPSHCGSWLGPHTWSSTSLASLKLDKSHHWPPSGVHCSQRQTPSTTRSSTVSAIRNTALPCSRNSHRWHAVMDQLGATTTRLSRKPRLSQMRNRHRRRRLTTNDVTRFYTSYLFINGWMDDVLLTYSRKQLTNFYCSNLDKNSQQNKTHTEPNNMM